MNPKIILFVALAGLLLIVAGCSKNTGERVILYKSDYCGCCGLYEKYLDNENFMVEVIETEDLAPIKEQWSIPIEMQSCHTMIIGDYFVEGHVPREAIDKLMNEKPDIRGIALPGMPSGSPGMPGAKKEQFVIFAIGKDGKVNEFMKI